MLMFGFMFWCDRWGACGFVFWAAGACICHLNVHHNRFVTEKLWRGKGEECYVWMNEDCMVAIYQDATMHEHGIQFGVWECHLVTPHVTWVNTNCILCMLKFAAVHLLWGSPGRVGRHGSSQRRDLQARARLGGCPHRHGKALCACMYMHRSQPT